MLSKERFVIAWSVSRSLPEVARRLERTVKQLLRIARRLRSAGLPLKELPTAEVNKPSSKPVLTGNPKACSMMIDQAGTHWIEVGSCEGTRHLCDVCRRPAVVAAFDGADEDEGDFLGRRRCADCVCFFLERGRELPDGSSIAHDAPITAEPPPMSLFLQKVYKVCNSEAFPFERPYKAMHQLATLPMDAGHEAASYPRFVEDIFDMSGEDWAAEQTAFYLAGLKESIEHVPPSVAEHIWWWVDGEV